MYTQWIIDEDRTKEEFGYTSKDLSYGSKKPVVVRCVTCNIITYKEVYYANRCHKCPNIKDGKKWCNKCKSWKELQCFRKNKNTKDGFIKCCTECLNKYPSVKRGERAKKDRARTKIDFYFMHKVNALKTRAKKFNITCTVSARELINLFNKQSGLCHYSNIPLIINLGRAQFNSISIDRKNPIKGYDIDNIVICSYSINSLKGTMNYQEFIKYLKIIIPNLQKFIAELERSDNG